MNIGKETEQIEFNKELTNQSTSDSSRTSAYGNKVFNTKISNNSR